MLTITNTHDDFAWLTNYLETLLSNALWKPINSATTADVFKRELIRHAEKTGFYDENHPENIEFLCHDFSMRGMSGVEDSIVSGMGHLTSFAGSETVPAVIGANYYYGAGLNWRGGCTAIGMKKQFPTVIQEDAESLEYMHVSAGKLGMQLKLSPKDLQKASNAKFDNVIHLSIALRNNMM